MAMDTGDQVKENGGEEKDSTINENNHKCKHCQTPNQMCLATTFVAGQLISL